MPYDDCSRTETCPSCPEEDSAYDAHDFVEKGHCAACAKDFEDQLRGVRMVLRPEPSTESDYLKCRCGHFQQTHRPSTEGGCRGMACDCDGFKLAPEPRCEGCGHPEHSGICRELEMPGPPGDVDECGCLDDREPPLTPEEEEELSLTEDDIDRMAAEGEPVELIPPPEGPEYTPCVCGHIEPEHEVDGYCYDEKCGCVGYRTKPDFVLPPQPDRRPPYLLAYSVQGHLYEIALPGDATVAALDGRLVITHQLGPVAGICQIAPITSEESTR